MKIQIRDIDESLHRRAKVLAAEMGVPLNTFFRDAISRECSRRMIEKLSGERAEERDKLLEFGKMLIDLVGPMTPTQRKAVLEPVLEQLRSDRAESAKRKKGK